MAVGDAYKLDLYQLYSGQRVMNSLVFDRKAEGIPDQAECLALATDWKTFLIARQVTALTHTGWKVQQLSGAGVTYPSGECRRVGGLAFEGGYTGTVAGANGGEGLPPQCAMVTTIKTGVSGRSKRGRFYLCGIPDGVTDGGNFGSGHVAGELTAWNAQGAKFFGAGSDLLWRIGVWSQTIATGCKPGELHPHTPTQVATPSPGTAFTAAIAFTPRAIVYTQRRRTIGVGA